MTAREMEAELALFWRLSLKLAALRIAFGGTPLLESKSRHTIDDLEVIAMHSDWPALRTAAEKMLQPELKRAVS